jgi:hypothetical protein
MASMWNEEESFNSNGGSELAPMSNEPLAMATGVVRGPDDGSTLALMVNAARALVRDQAKLIARAKQIGGLLGSDGFYRFPAGGSTVQGPSIDMAQALAQEWGGIVYQVRIVSAVPLASGGQRVHLRASVADMKSLVAAEVDQIVTTSPPPGKFANKLDQVERWNGMQIQSAASKIVRNALLRVLPAWFVNAAFDAAVELDGNRALNGKTLPEARKGASDALLALGCALQEIEAFLGQPLDMWAVPQISALRDLYKQINTGALSVEAWRVALQEKADPTTGAPKRSALGLPTSNGGQTVDDASKSESREPVGTQNGTSEAASRARR